MSHANAILTPRGRLRLARCVVDEGWPLRRAAERFQVSVTTASRWPAASLTSQVNTPNGPSWTASARSNQCPAKATATILP